MACNHYGECYIPTNGIVALDSIDRVCGNATLYVDHIDGDINRIGGYVEVNELKQAFREYGGIPLYNGNGIASTCYGLTVSDRLVVSFIIVTDKVYVEYNVNDGTIERIMLLS